MMQNLLALITAQPLAGKRTYSLVAIALGAMFWYATSDSTTWIYAHIEEVLTMLGLGKIATIRMAISNLGK